MYYDMSISYPYLSLITPLSFYSISFSAYSYPVSPMPIHFIGSFPSIRHRTQLLISVHFHLNTPYLLPSFILSLFYSSIHFLLSLISSSLTTPFSFILSSFFPFIPFHIILSLPYYSHSIFHPIPYQHHSPILFFLSLLQATLWFDSLLLFSSLFPDSYLLPFYSSYCFSSPLSLPLSSSTLIRTHSILFILFSPIFRSFYSNHLLYHPYSFPYYLSLSINSSSISLTTSFSYFPLTSITLPSTNTTIKSLHTHILSTHSFFSSSSTTPSSSTSFQTLSAVLSHSLSHTLYYPPFSSPNTHRFFSYPIYNPSPLQSTLTTSTSLYYPSSLHTPLRAIISISTDPTPSLFSSIILYIRLSLSTNGIPDISPLNSSKLNLIHNNWLLYIVASLEVCSETGRLHYQIYMEFEEMVTVRQIKRILHDPSAPIE